MFRENCSFIILAGGLGSRLANIQTGIPKCLTPINGIPIINLHIKNALEWGYDDIFVLAGHKSDVLKKTIRKNYTEKEVTIFEEKELLGTGGGLYQYKHEFNYKTALVVNGDTLIKINKKQKLINDQKNYIFSKKNQMFTNQEGSLLLGHNNSVISFNEKEETIHTKDKFTNIGMYLFDIENLPIFKKKVISIEYDILPELIKNNSLYNLELNCDYLDIGTEKNFIKKDTFLES